MPSLSSVVDINGVKKGSGETGCWLRPDIELRLSAINTLLWASLFALSRTIKSIPCLIIWFLHKPVDWESAFLSVGVLEMTAGDINAGHSQRTEADRHTAVLAKTSPLLLDFVVF